MGCSSFVIYSTTTATIILSRTTCVRQYSWLNTGSFCYSSFIACTSLLVATSASRSGKKSSTFSMVQSLLCTISSSIIVTG